MSSARSTCGPAGPSCTRARTRCSRWPFTSTSSRWTRCTSGAGSRGGSSRRSRVGRVIARPFEGAPGAFVRSPDRRDFSVPPPGPTVLDRMTGGRGRRATASARSGTSSPARASPSPATRDSDDDGVDLTLEYLGGRGPRSCSRTWWTSTRSTGTATTRRGTRRRRGVRPAIAGAGRGPRRRRPAHDRRPRVRPDDAADRPLAGAHAAAGAGCPGGPAEIGTRAVVRRPGGHRRRAPWGRGRGSPRAELRGELGLGRP